LFISRKGWDRYVGARGDMLGVQRFGASAPAAVVLCEYGFTVDNVCRARKSIADIGTEAEPGLNVKP